MKKALAALLALILAACTLTTVVSAGSATTAAGTTDIGVSSSVVTTPTTVTISVDITWDSMEFIYNAPAEDSWDPKTHSYAYTTTGGFEPNARKQIKVVNHSNAAVFSSIGFETTASSRNSDITHKFESKDANGNYAVLSDTKTSLISAVGQPIDNGAPTMEYYFSVEGGTGIEESKKIGKLAVLVGEATTTVSTEAELREAVKYHGTITLTSDIALDFNPLKIKTSDITIDLNNHTLSNPGNTVITIEADATKNVTIKNGIITGSAGTEAIVSNIADNLVIEKVEIQGGAREALVIEAAHGTATLKDCKLTCNATYDHAALKFTVAEGGNAVIAMRGNTEIFSYVDCAYTGNADVNLYAGTYTLTGTTIAKVAKGYTVDTTNKTYTIGSTTFTYTEISSGNCTVYTVDEQ